MTENEWEQSHPSQTESYIDAWTEKQKREDVRNSLLQLVIAQGAGMKIKNRKVTLKDFLPEYAKPDPQDELMAEVAREVAKQQNQNG